MSRNIKKSLVSNDDNKSKFFLNKLKRTGEMSAWLAGKWYQNEALSQNTRFDHIIVATFSGMRIHHQYTTIYQNISLRAFLTSWFICLYQYLLQFITFYHHCREFWQGAPVDKKARLRRFFNYYCYFLYEMGM